MGKENKPSRYKSQITASTPEAIENEMIALAYQEVEYRIRNHTASSQELVHFLRMGSERERREREKLESEIELQRIKAAAIESAKQTEELYENAINAMKLYSGAMEE